MGNLDSDSASLGSNPSSPATINGSIPPTLTISTNEKIRTDGGRTPHKSRHKDTSKPRLTPLRGGWAVSYWKNGKRRRFFLGTNNLTEARERLAAWREPERGTEPIHRRKSMLYFIRSECPNRYIKIGLATDLNSRLSSLQVSSAYELTVLATMSGGKAEEIHLHKRFEHTHLRGEWFKPSDDLLRYIDDLPKKAAIREFTANDIFDHWKSLVKAGALV